MIDLAGVGRQPDAGDIGIEQRRDARPRASDRPDSAGRNGWAGCRRASWRIETSWYRAPPSPSGSTGPLSRHRLIGRVIDPGSGLHQRLGAGEIGLDLAARERPAGMGHPVAAFEIDLVQRPAPAAPVIGAAAQKAQPPAIQRRYRRRRSRCRDTELLGLGIEAQRRRIPAAAHSGRCPPAPAPGRCRPGRRR